MPNEFESEKIVTDQIQIGQPFNESVKSLLHGNSHEEMMNR